MQCEGCHGQAAIRYGHKQKCTLAGAGKVDRCQNVCGNRRLDIGDGLDVFQVYTRRRHHEVQRDRSLLLTSQSLLDDLAAPLCQHATWELCPEAFSGLTSRFSIRVVPCARAASSKMRFDRDLDPGSFTWP